MSKSPTDYHSPGSPSSDEYGIDLEKPGSSTDTGEESKIVPLHALSQGTEEASTSSYDPNRGSIQEDCHLSLPPIPVTTTDGSTKKVPTWEQPTNRSSSLEELLSLLEEEAKKTSSTPYSRISLLTKLTLESPPSLCAADELLQSINNIETSLTFLLSSATEGKKVKSHPAKLIGDVELSKKSFIKFVQSCVSEESQLSEDYICTLRDAIFSEAEIFENKSIRAINDNLIISTKQSSLSNAVEEKLVNIFKEDLDKIRAKFISLIPCKSDDSESSEHVLQISECERAEILIHMLMCYAKITERVIFREKTKCLSVIFVKFGHIHITKLMSDKLHSLIEKLPQMVSTILTRKGSLIAEEISKKGYLDESFIRNIIVSCTRSEELKDLENAAKEIILRLCHKIIINGDQLIPRSVVIYRHVTSIFIYNLVKSVKNCVRTNISNSSSLELLTNMPTQEETSSSIPDKEPIAEKTAIKSPQTESVTELSLSPSHSDPSSPSYSDETHSSGSATLSRKRSHTPPDYQYHEKSKKSRDELPSQSEQGYEKPVTMPTHPLLQITEEASTSASDTSRDSKKGEIHSSPSSISDESTDVVAMDDTTTELTVWKKPANKNSLEELLHLLEEEASKTSSTPYSKTSLLTRLTLESPPPCAADELLRAINIIEISLTFLISSTITDGRAVKSHPAKSISEVDLSQGSFVKFIQSCISEKSQLSENYICTLRDAIFSEAKIFENKSIKLINEDTNFIIATKQSLLSSAAEERLISIFKEDLDTIKSKFISLITCKSDDSESSEQELQISECERTEILIHMLMCYAKIAEGVISKEKTKCIDAIFVKFGHIHITKLMSDKLQSLIKKLPQIVSKLLTKEHSLIAEEVAKTGYLDESFTRNIIVSCTRSEEVKSLEKAAKEVVLRLCHKIIINDDHLISRSVVVYKHVASTFIYNLVKSLENCVRTNINSLFPEILTRTHIQEGPSSSKELSPIATEKTETSLVTEDIAILQTSTTAETTGYAAELAPLYSDKADSPSGASSSRKRSHTPLEYHHSERKKKPKSELFSYLAEGCENLGEEYKSPTSDINWTQVRKNMEEKHKSPISDTNWAKIRKNMEEKHRSPISALTKLQLMSESTPNAATELVESIRKIEADLASTSDEQGPSTTEPSSEKSINDMEYSANNFMRVIKHLLGEKSRVENIEISKLSREITLSAKEFEQTFLKIANDEEKTNNLIRETKQYYLANAIEKKLIDIFNSNLVEVKERFRIALQSLQERSYSKSATSLAKIKLTLPEKSINRIVVHMLMCYARMSEKLICDKKILYSNLETFFAKIGQIYITKHLHSNLEKVKAEFHGIVTNTIVKRNSTLIEETVRATGKLNQLFIDNIVSECINGNEQLLKEKIKLVLSQHCGRIALDNGQLIPSNPRVEEYLVNESLISLKQEIESILVRSSIKYMESPADTD
ncbi:hypothetical protein [Candidatus Ichthyocystis hellenicum]|uniref:hypothetical protein n=1 Tax=Candidatus Ichthyocystis hellenicum TaxID=1561003 RepID=UPI000B85BF72|nr:hypothetical protein [Candidatus Ichthyocystis hellenicum]